MTNKSEVMRMMYEEGKNISEIQKELKCHYSYVYGVIQRYCKKTNQEIRHDRKESKSDTIRMMVDEGKSVGTIAKELNANYSFVFSVVKKYKESK